MKTILYNTNTYCPPGGAGVSQYFQPKLYKVDGIYNISYIIYHILLKGQKHERKH